MAKIKTARNTTKREVILQHAAALFKTNSYSTTSMRELADAIGVEAPSLYNHIGSKSELLQHICFSVGNSFIEKAHKISLTHEPTLSKIESIIRFHIQAMIDQFNEVYVANHEWMHLNEPYLSDFLAIRREYEKSLIDLIEKGISEGSIRTVNPYVAALTILSAVRGLEFWQRNKKNINQQVLEDDMVSLLLKGLIQP